MTHAEARLVRVGDVLAWDRPAAAGASRGIGSVLAIRYNVDGEPQWFDFGLAPAQAPRVLHVAGPEIIHVHFCHWPTAQDWAELRAAKGVR